MFFNSQKDSRWGSKRLGNSSTTIKANGCAICSIGNMVSLNPDYVNDQLKANGGFSGGLVIWSVAAKLWNLHWDTNQAKPTGYPCIACTNHFIHQGYPQHFFLLLASGEIVDPLDGKQKQNPYHIISYRNLHPK